MTFFNFNQELRSNFWGSVFIVSLLLLWPRAWAAADPIDFKQTPANSVIDHLAEIASDGDPHVIQMNAMMDPQRVVIGLYFESVDTSVSSPQKEMTLYPMADVQSPKGVVLNRRAGVETLILKGAIDSAQGTGTLWLRYLRNFFFRSYGTCKAQLAVDQNGNWQLFNETGSSLVTNLFIRTATLGITAIEPLCTSN